MTPQQTHINIPERRDDEPPATAKQLQLIRQLSTGRSLQGYRFDYRKLGNAQAATILNQLQAMNEQHPISNKPSKQGPGCIASLAKGTTALIVWALVLAGVAGGGYLIYWQMNQTPAPTDTAQNDATDPQDTTDAPSNRPGTGNTATSNIFEGLGVSDSPNTPTDPTPDTPNRTTDLPEPTPEPTPPPTPTVDRALASQLKGLEAMLVQLSQFTRNDFAADIRDQSSQAMHKKLADYPQALSALDAADPVLSARIRAVIDAFAAPQIDGPALREEIKSLRASIDKLQ